MAKFRLNEILVSSSNMKVVKDYTNESRKPIYTSENRLNGTSILGEVEGIFFVPDGESANNRFYSRKFWETVLAKQEVKSALARRIMFGTIGHYDRAIDEKDIETGITSHIVTNLFINKKGEGIGKAIILNTESGRNLYTCLAAGSDLKVSSRASGDYKQGEVHRSSEGDMPVMDEDTYTLDTFDFVIHPGFIETNPELVENKNKNNENIKMENAKTLKKKETPMSKQEQDNSYKAALATEKAKKLEQRCTNLEELAKKSANMLEAYTAIGSAKEISTKLEELENFKKLADSPKQLQESLAKTTKVLKEHNTVKATAAKVENYKKVLEESKETLKAYTELGSIETIKEGIKALKAYTNIGSIQEVSSYVKTLANIKKENEQTLIAKKVKEYSKKAHLPLEVVRNVYENAKNIKSAEKVLESMSKSAKDSRYEGNFDSLKALKSNKAKKSSKSEDTAFNKFNDAPGALASRIVERNFGKSLLGKKSNKSIMS